MAEYIDRQAAIKAILGQPSEMHYPVWYASEVTDIPPADVRPVVRGHWINLIISVSGSSSAECSQCGTVVYDSFSNEINYCPKCGSYNGADMKSGDAE